MKAICRVYGAQKNVPLSEETWGLCGLLHDADYELTRNTPEKHTLYLEEKIGKALPKEVMYAIKAHNYKFTNVAPVTAMDWALYTCDELTGFIVACGLVQKDKKLANVTVDMVLKKMQDNSFAKSVDRAQIVVCEEKLGFPIREYVAIVLGSMQAISRDLGFDG